MMPQQRFLTANENRDLRNLVAHRKKKKRGFAGRTRSLSGTWKSFCCIFSAVTVLAIVAGATPNSSAVAGSSSERRVTLIARSTKWALVSNRAVCAASSDAKMMIAVFGAESAVSVKWLHQNHDPPGAGEIMLGVPE
jgi:hypothetical protein